MLWQVVPHGVEFTKYQQDVLPAELPWSNKFVFLFNGGLLPRKGIDILIKVGDVSASRALSLVHF